MSEITDMMLEGFLDEQTGEVIDGSAPGYPRTMEGGNYNSIHKSPIRNGVEKFLRMKGLKNKQLHTTIMRKYLNSHAENKEFMCVKIQQDFNTFKNYVADNLELFYNLQNQIK